jgi:hypothetical protein
MTPICHTWAIHNPTSLSSLLLLHYLFTIQTTGRVQGTQRTQRPSHARLGWRGGGGAKNATHLGVTAPGCTCGGTILLDKPTYQRTLERVRPLLSSSPSTSLLAHQPTSPVTLALDAPSPPPPHPHPQTGARPSRGPKARLGWFAWVGSSGRGCTPRTVNSNSRAGGAGGGQAQGAALRGLAWVGSSGRGCTPRTVNSDNRATIGGHEPNPCKAVDKVAVVAQLLLLKALALHCRRQRLV